MSYKLCAIFNVATSSSLSHIQGSATAVYVGMKIILEDNL